MVDFLDIDLMDVLDILLVGLLIYYAFRVLRGSQAMSIFLAIVALYLVRLISTALNMRLISSIIGTLLDVGLLALIVIFQPEIRRFLVKIGSRYRMTVVGKFITRYWHGEQRSEKASDVNEICRACEEMGEEKCGALIVMQKRDSLQDIVDTGDLIDARISKRLLKNLFFKNSPLHDGAVIIADGRVVAARCTLPITEKSMPASFGMRHKAAVGISEVSDAQVIVVSEETGGISVMYRGDTVHVDNINDLKRLMVNAGE